MTEFVTNIPLIEEATASIKQSGSFEKNLRGQELANIMGTVVSNLLSGQEAVKASIPHMDVLIENDQGTVAGNIQIKKPIKAEINIECVLGNAGPNQLKLVSLNVKEKAGMAAKLALKAVNIKKRTKEALTNPNQALFKTLATQLEPKGIDLTSIGLQFQDNLIGISLSGKEK